MNNDGFVIENGVLVRYLGDAKEVIIPNGVFKIYSRAFTGCRSLKRINIPNSVTTIGDKAFFSCEDLKSINIPNGVTKIGSLTFANCKSLTNITIPDGVTTIGENAFRGCKSLTEVIIPDGVKKIENKVFYGCENLKSVNFSDSVTEIEVDAFEGCRNLSKKSWLKIVKINAEVLFKTPLDEEFYKDKEFMNQLKNAMATCLKSRRKCEENIQLAHKLRAWLDINANYEQSIDNILNVDREKDN